MEETKNASCTSATEKIRDQIRRDSEIGRYQNRQKAANRIRKNLQETENELRTLNEMTCEELDAAVAQIRRGNKTSHLHLRAIKQALNDSKNVVAFLKTTGALQAVVGHLTGTFSF